MFSPPGVSRDAMDKYVVLSLHTDGLGPRRGEFSELLQEMTGTSSVPSYVVVDPDPAGDRVLAVYDYNHTVPADDFGPRLDKARRRFERNLKRRRALSGRKTTR